MKRRVLLGLLLAGSWPTSSLAADEPTSNTWIRRGADLFKHEDYEGARAAFGRAYELDPKATTLFDLGLSELNADHPVEAAAHLRDYLKHAEEPAAKLESVRTKWLPRAEARTARLNVFAPAGAQLAIDGVIQEPMTAASSATGSAISVVIAAGEHDVSARQGTVVEAQHVVARGGELVEVHLQRVPDAPPPAAAMGWSLAGSERAREGAGGTTPRAKWITVIALGSGALLAAGVGVGFRIASQNKARDVASLHNEIAAGSTWTTSQCSGGSGSSGLCTELRRDIDANRQDWTLSTAAYIGGGVLAAATAATWMLWKPKSAAVVARPTLGPRSAGLELGAAW